MDETYHAICLKKDSFFLPFPLLVFEVTSHSVHGGSVAQVKHSPAYLSQPLQMIGPPWEGKRKKGCRKEGCTLKSSAVVTQERG